MDAWNNRDKYPLHPVWLLTGPRGIGKATLAYKLARMVYGNVGDFSAPLEMTCGALCVHEKRSFV